MRPATSSPDSFGESVGSLTEREISPGQAWHNRAGLIDTSEALDDSDVLEASTPFMDDVIRLKDNMAAKAPARSKRRCSGCPKASLGMIRARTRDFARAGLPTETSCSSVLRAEVAWVLRPCFWLYSDGRSDHGYVGLRFLRGLAREALLRRSGR